MPAGLEAWRLDAGRIGGTRGGWPLDGRRGLEEILTGSTLQEVGGLPILKASMTHIFLLKQMEQNKAFIHVLCVCIYPFSAYPSSYRCDVTYNRYMYFVYLSLRIHIYLLAL